MITYFHDSTNNYQLIPLIQFNEDINFNSQYKLVNVHCTLYSVQCTLNSLYSVRCTVNLVLYVLLIKLGGIISVWCTIHLLYRLL